jgi:hypothetical protein
MNTERHNIPDWPGYQIDRDGVVWDLRGDEARRVAPNAKGFVTLKNDASTKAHTFRPAAMLAIVLAEPQDAGAEPEAPASDEGVVDEAAADTSPLDAASPE